MDMARKESNKIWMIYKSIAPVLTCFLSGLFVDTLAAVFVLQKPNNNTNISQRVLQSLVVYTYLLKVYSPSQVGNSLYGVFAMTEHFPHVK